MYKLKTGGLIEASMMIGAILAGATAKEVDAIENIAGDIGLAFQIRDDILDVISNDKFLVNRFILMKILSPHITIMDIEQAKYEVEKVTDRARKAYESLPYENEYLEALIMS